VQPTHHRYIDPEAPIPRRLPGEPQRDSPPPRRFAGLIVRRVILLSALGSITLPLWIPYLLGVCVAGWPPNVPQLGQVAAYFGLIWRHGKPPPGLPILDQLALTCAVRQTLTVPVWGLAWFLDALIFGRAMATVEIRAPLFHISGARSGSTQLSRYLEADPDLLAPNVLQIMFPYLWLWRVVAPLAARFLDLDALQKKVAAGLPPEFRERHEGHFYRTDTFEVGFCAAHLNRLARYLGPDAIVDEFSMAQTSPGTERLWTETFVDYLDGVARKALLFAGPAATGRRLFVKGHFLAAADVLATRYPDARFLTIVRSPTQRLRSMINFLWTSPNEMRLASPPWRWLAEGLARSEVNYNRNERAWFTRANGPRRCVLRFDDFVRDLEGTLSAVYRDCLDHPTLPAHVLRTHAPRRRTGYTVDRSLESLGIDPDAYLAAQADYVAWCADRGAPPDQSAGVPSGASRPASSSGGSADCSTASDDAGAGTSAAGVTPSTG